MRRSLGLDKPLWDAVRAVHEHLFHGNLGDSITTSSRPATVILERLPPTLFLVAYAALLAAADLDPGRRLSALRRGGIFDQVARVCVPDRLRDAGLLARDHPDPHLLRAPELFPVNGYGDTSCSHLDYLFLPAVTIALGFSTILVRTLRASTLAALSSDYVDTARIKGISRFAVLRKHVLRNAIMSVVVVFGINLAFLISGTVMWRTSSRIPGSERLLVDSVSTRDYPVVQGVTLIFAFLIVVVNLLTDVVHAALDPRVVAGMSAHEPGRALLLERFETRARRRCSSRLRRRATLIVGWPDARHRDRPLPRRAALHELRPADARPAATRSPRRSRRAHPRHRPVRPRHLVAHPLRRTHRPR